MFVSWETLFWISHESLEPLLNLFYYISINGKWGWGALRSTQKLFIRLNHRASPQSLLKCHHITHWTHFRIIIIFFFCFRRIILWNYPCTAYATYGAIIIGQMSTLQGCISLVVMVIRIELILNGSTCRVLSVLGAVENSKILILIWFLLDYNV